MLTTQPFTYQPDELIPLFRRRQFSFMRGRLIILGLLMLVLAAIASRDQSGIIWGVFGMTQLFLVIWITWILPRQMLNNLKKASVWGKPIQYTFDDKGFTQQTPLGTSHVQWQAIVQASETSDWFILSPGPAMVFYAIPKRALADTQQQDTLRGLLQQHKLLKA
ncbi:MAG: YcxB family protein [Bacteroidia bacterium]|nr:YcxB family protein [Bacteroidia bacterium]